MHNSHKRDYSQIVDALDLGARIKQARERSGLSQDDLASELHRDQRAVSEMETGKRRISATELPVIARVLNVPLLYFYEGDLNINDLDRAVLDEFHRLPSNDAKRSAIEIIRVLSNALENQVK